MVTAVANEAKSKPVPSNVEIAQAAKMKPITGWWSILRPLVLLGLRIKR